MKCCAEPSAISSLRTVRPTPTVQVECDGHPPVWCKLEFVHESGSTKDRIARHILLDAWDRGLLCAGGTVAEASSGSTSIAMAGVCARLGVRFIAVMPEGVSKERLLMIRGFGATVLLTPCDEGIKGALRATELLGSTEGAFLPRQFQNELNVQAHRLGTARELAEQVPGGRIDAFSSGVGTGGTLVGLYYGLRDAGIAAQPFAARPVEGLTGALCSCFRSAECSCFSARIPGVLDNMSQLYKPAELEGLVEIDVSDDEAIAATRAIIRTGYPVGPSSGLNIVAAWRAAELLGDGASVATVLCDRAERYFSTELFAPFAEG
ncbi:MAG: pyridoxal-phosphate dependent enzyme [Phycisphaerales bacterium]|nr:pyridoxal-phosphate dependent enzyme [Phycisphaerales bacterium]